MSQNATEKYGGDELGHLTIITSKSKGLYQHIRAPSTSLPASLGQRLYSKLLKNHHQIHCFMI